MRSSLQKILLAPNVNLYVSKSDMNPDGGHTYSVTFPTSMKNVPQMEVYLSDVPVFISTLEDANLLQGFFRLEFKGEVTREIPVNAEAIHVKSALEELELISQVSVIKYDLSDQDGCTWRIQFLSDENGGDLEDLIVHSQDVYTTNSVGGASVQLISGGIDGSYIKGSFAIQFGEINF
jgi:hypothetical protein